MKNFYDCVPELSGFVIFDLETTGLSPQEDSIIEISAVKVRGNEITEEYSTFVNPGFHIPETASSVSGITDEMVKDAPGIEQALSDFTVFISDDVLVGHNIINFDLKFINKEMTALWGKALPNDYLDTLIMAKRYLPELQSRSLESLSGHYGISYAGAHRALCDCKINYEVYKHLIEEMRHPSQAALTVVSCPECGNLLKKREGKFGTFWGCRSYPECKYTRNSV